MQSTHDATRPTALLVSIRTPKVALRREFPEAMLISTRRHEDIQALRERILHYAESDMIDEDLFVPYTAKGIVGEIRATTRVVQEDFEAEGIRFRVKSKAADVERLKKMIQQVEK